MHVRLRTWLAGLDGSIKLIREGIPYGRCLALAVYALRSHCRGRSWLGFCQTRYEQVQTDPASRS